MPKFTTGHFFALQREEIQLYPPEDRHKLPPTRKPWQAISLTPPTGSNLHNKKEPQTSSLQKGHPKHSNLKKMKRPRDIKQVKEHDKNNNNNNPPNQTKEAMESLYIDG